MEIIPAVDIANGKCVRLTRGELGAQKVYFQNPVDAAVFWKKRGAKKLHLVDLDGAFSGSPKSMSALKQIAALGLGVQFGGGLRTRKQIATALEYGADKVVLGTSLFSKNAREVFEAFPGRVIAAIDCKQGKVCTKGWVENTGVPAQEAAVRAQALGACSVLVTDVSRDGVLRGPNCKLVGEVASAVKIPVIASGGVSCIEDLKALEKAGATSAVVGKALYEKKFSLADAFEEFG
ncbi:MAG: 1-(5-phosphoribosyl)-5-[(5-phosphoribosylamino)methylideneamino]imidazole-4-carboxamide isomerase [Candidatus Micrarchaeia archaeon]|jgi:phosphoribosylformimino-5-aminoimidazole carboxamide ribotide isomerase